jgi:hypothetical protein
MLGGMKKILGRMLEDGTIRVLVEKVFGTHCLQNNSTEENV